MIMGPIYRASQANIWITGTVYGSNWASVSVLVPVTAGLVIITILMIRNLNVQELGEEIATNVGSRVQKSIGTIADEHSFNRERRCICRWN